MATPSQDYYLEELDEREATVVEVMTQLRKMENQFNYNYGLMYQRMLCLESVMGTIESKIDMHERERKKHKSEEETRSNPPFIDLVDK